MIGGQGEEDAWVIDSARARRATMMAGCTLLGMMRGCADNHPSEGARVGAGRAHAGARAGAQAEWARGAEPGRRLATVRAAHGPLQWPMVRPWNTGSVHGLRLGGVQWIASQNGPRGACPRSSPCGLALCWWSFYFLFIRHRSCTTGVSPPGNFLNLEFLLPRAGTFLVSFHLGWNGK